MELPETVSHVTADGRTLELPNVAHWQSVVYDSTPGRFEGEGPETAYFYDMSCSGFGGEILEWNEHESGGSELFETTEEERIAFGVETVATHFLLSWDSQGFITGEWLTELEAKDARRRAERAREQAEEERERELAASDRQPVFQLRHSAASGCSLWTSENGPKYATMADAIDALNVRAEELRAAGFEVLAEDCRPGCHPHGFEVLEPDGCAMVPDEVGRLFIVDDVAACERENERRRESY